MQRWVTLTTSWCSSESHLPRCDAAVSHTYHVVMQRRVRLVAEDGLDQGGDGLGPPVPHPAVRVLAHLPHKHTHIQLSALAHMAHKHTHIQLSVLAHLSHKHTHTAISAGTPATQTQLSVLAPPPPHTHTNNGHFCGAWSLARSWAQCAVHKAAGKCISTYNGQNKKGFGPYDRQPRKNWHAAVSAGTPATHRHKHTQTQTHTHTHMHTESGERFVRLLVIGL